MLAPFRILTAIAIATAFGCGAGDAVAPEPEARPECPQVDDYLQPLYTLLDEGKLDHLATVIEDEVAGDLQRDLVAALVRLVGAFEPGTFAALNGISDEVAESGDLQQFLAQLLRWLGSDGPQAPYLQAFGALRGMLASCDWAPILELLLELLNDDELAAALSELGGSLDLGIEIDLAGLEFDTATGREALRALVRNILVAASSPSFDVEVLLELAAIIVDFDEPPWDVLADAIRGLLGPGPTLEALQGLMRCLQVVDEELALIDMVFDLATDESLDLLGTLGEMLAPPEPPPEDGAPAELLPEELAAPLNAALAFLIEDQPAWQAIARVLTRILADANAAPVLQDIASLLEAEIIGDVVAVLASLATRSCPQ